MTCALSVLSSAPPTCKPDQHRWFCVIRHNLQLAFNKSEQSFSDQCSPYCTLSHHCRYWTTEQMQSHYDVDLDPIPSSLVYNVGIYILSFLHKKYVYDISSSPTLCESINCISSTNPFPISLYFWEKISWSVQTCCVKHIQNHFDDQAILLHMFGGSVGSSTTMPVFLSHRKVILLPTMIIWGGRCPRNMFWSSL